MELEEFVKFLSEGHSRWSSHSEGMNRDIRVLRAIRHVIMKTRVVHFETIDVDTIQCACSV